MLTIDDQSIVHASLNSEPGQWNVELANQINTYQDDAMFNLNKLLIWDIINVPT